MSYLINGKILIFRKYCILQKLRLLILGFKFNLILFYLGNFAFN